MGGRVDEGKIMGEGRGEVTLQRGWANVFFVSQCAVRSVKNNCTSGAQKAKTIRADSFIVLGLVGCHRKGPPNLARVLNSVRANQPIHCPSQFRVRGLSNTNQVWNMVPSAVKKCILHQNKK
jgi:hypothetical protein